MTSPSQSLNVKAQAERKPDMLRWIPVLSAGFIVAMVEIFMAVSFASLLFTRNSAPFVVVGMTMALSGAAVMNAIYSLFSYFPGSIANPQGNEIAILAVAAGAISIAPGISPVEAFATIVSVVLITLLLKALLFILIGQLKLSYLIRFLPYPVIGGFLAGSGWLLIAGSIRLMTGIKVEIANLGALFMPDEIAKWVLGIAFGVTLFSMMRLLKHYLVMPLALGIAIGSFYLAANLLEISTESLVALGWLLSPFESYNMWQVASLSFIPDVNLQLLLEQVGTIATVLVVGSIHYLLNASSLELLREQDMDMDSDLKATGLANLVSGMSGGLGGYLSLSTTSLVNQMNVRSRWAGIISAVVILAFLFIGKSLVIYLPIPLLGGFIFYLGLEFIAKWVFTGAQRMPKPDYAIVLLIMISMLFIGLLESIAIGLLLAVVVFVVNYSRIKIVKHVLSGANRPSTVDRNPQERHILSNKGEQILILRLQGFIFFGTANNLFEQVRTRIHDKSMQPLRFVILDYHFVTGLDSSALFSFVKMKQLLKSNHSMMIFTGISPDVQDTFAYSEFPLEANDTYLIFPDLDHAIEWCEEQILHNAETIMPFGRRKLPDQLRDAFSILEHIPIFMQYLEAQHLPEGEKFIAQGDQSEDIYFVEKGTVTVLLELDKQNSVRIRTMGAGTVIGEIGLYLNAPRGASVVTQTSASVYRLSRENLKKLTLEHPEVAASFHEAMAFMLAERLNKTNQTMRALLE